MFEVELLDNVLEMLYFPVSEGFESTIFLTEYDNYAKIFKQYVPDHILLRKQRMIISLHFTDLCDEFSLIPETYRLVYTSDGKFSGYFMVPVPGKTLDEYCIENKTEINLSVLKNLEEGIKIIHEHGYCLADFNPQNILVSHDLSVRFVDVDSFCFMNESSKNMFTNYKYVCPYTKVIDKMYNRYSFYALALDMLFGLNKVKNNNKLIIKLIKKSSDLPEEIKTKLIYFVKIHSKSKLLKLEPLF